MSPFTSAGVLGAGTMGAQIAAHFANAGVPVLLLDLTREIAAEGLKRARALKPDPFFTADTHLSITVGGFDQDLSKVSACDWIVEAIVEELEAKQDLLARLEPHRRAETIVSSNTSGISIAALAEGRSESFRRDFLGTHFFNPPRYLPLVEVVPTRDTDPATLTRVIWMLDHRLGKGIVIAKDSPNFIANHIGIHGVVRVLDALAHGKYTIEEIDAITGAPLGRPKSATFRTLDVVGIDVVRHVIRNLSTTIDGPSPSRVPPLLDELQRRGWLGEKTGQGFYKRHKRADGDSEILVLDPATFEYRSKQKVHIPSIEAARNLEDPRDRVKLLFGSRDKAGEFLRETLAPSLIYTARVTPDIAHSMDDIDRAMKWGFGWELGPFELVDAIGVREVLAAAAVTDPPPLLKRALDEGRNRIRSEVLPPAQGDLLLLRTARSAQRVVKSNVGASLIDLGDGVLAVEFHSKMNALGGDSIEMLNAGVREASRNFAALVVANEAPHFSAGANLMLLLLEAQEENWDDIDVGIRAFQSAVTGLRLAAVPVVVAPAGMTLGGGCELVLHADRVQAAAEAYIGLVETGVGLIPAGGGTKELLARSVDALPRSVDSLPFVQRVFETIAFAKVSTSAADARRLGFLRDADVVTMNRERLTADAKTLALELVREGYQPPGPRIAIPVGGANLLAGLKLGIHLAWRSGRITDHDKVVAGKLAWVLAGGNLPASTTVTEQYLLDLEREAFLSLCGERKTQERIGHTLKTGKTLRN